MDLETLDSVEKRDNDWFDTEFFPEYREAVLMQLKNEYSATENLWPVVWQEVLIAVWLNCPEQDVLTVASEVTKRWLKAEKMRVYRKKNRQEDLEGGDELPNVEPDSWDLQPYLELLTEQQRVVVSARYEYGMTEQEIAQELGMSQPAVSQMLKRVKKTLKEKMSG